MIYNVYANPANMGDYLSHLGIQHLLGVAVESLHCDRPYLSRLKALSERADPEDLFIVGGGGLIAKYFEPMWQLLSQTRGRIVVWGVGVCDHKTGSSLPCLRLARDVVARSELVSLRDEHTLHVLHAGNHCHVTGCPSVAALSGLRAAGSSGEHVLVVDHPDLRAAYRARHGLEAHSALREAAACLGEQTGLPLLEIDNRSRLSLTPDRCRQYIRATYSRAEYVITSRLHGAIIALALGVPTAAWSNDRKIDSFFELAGLPGWCCDHPHELKPIAQTLHAQPSVTFAEDVVARNQAFAELVKQCMA